MFFFKNYAENETKRLIPDLFLFFKKPLYEVKGNGMQLSFNHFRQSSTWQTIKNFSIDPEICSILILLKKA